MGEKPYAAQTASLRADTIWLKKCIAPIVFSLHRHCKAVGIDHMKGQMTQKATNHWSWAVLLLFNAVLGIVNVVGLYAWFWYPERADKEILRQLRYEFGNDALQAARSLGRLDIVTFWLTVLGIFLAIAALVGYKFVKNEAGMIALKEAKMRFDQYERESSIKKGDLRSAAPTDEEAAKVNLTEDNGDLENLEEVGGSTQ